MKFLALLLAHALAQTTCPTPTGPCALNCTLSSSCYGFLDCSTNSLCTVNCVGGMYCNTFNVTGLYEPDPAKYTSLCRGPNPACSSVVFTTRLSPVSRFMCDGSSACIYGSLNCRSDSCDFTCSQYRACKDTNFRCPGGSGKSCVIRCDGGCYEQMKVTCENYPCNVTVIGNQTTGFTAPCPPGQLLCGDGGCVNALATYCPSRCIRNDPCNTTAGNLCEDVEVVGGPIKCTCNAPGFVNGTIDNDGTVTTCVMTPAPTNTPTPPTAKPTSAPTLTPTTATPTTLKPTSMPTSVPPTSMPTAKPTATPSTNPPTNPAVVWEKNSLLIVKLFANNNCTGTPTEVKTLTSCADDTPNPGTIAFSNCVNNQYCWGYFQGFNLTCSEIPTACTPFVNVGVCTNGQIGMCTTSGASKVAELVGSSSSILVAFLLMFYCQFF